MVKSAEQGPMAPSTTGTEWGSEAAGACEKAGIDRATTKRVKGRARVMRSCWFIFISSKSTPSAFGFVGAPKDGGGSDGRSSLLAQRAREKWGTRRVCMWKRVL